MYIPNNSWPLHNMENTGPILFGQNMTPRFSMCSISTNILTDLANFLGIQNSIFSKNIGHDHGNTINMIPVKYISKL